MGSMVYVVWVMQSLYHQPYELVALKELLIVSECPAALRTGNLAKLVLVGSAEIP